jgi:DNA polymerase-1
MSSRKKSGQNSQERLFLLDGMALAYRAYFSFITRPLTNSRGENTSAIFGFVNTLMKILDERPEHVAVVFDTKEPTFRHVMYQPYKATRQKMPEDMAGQIDTLKDVVRAFNVPCLELPGYEADDIMGTLARKAERQGIDTYLVTGDKDFMQLISPRIKMYRPGKRGDEWEVLDQKAVKEKFGVTPDRVIDVLGLIGDKSDNVPGVSGIGEKTAIPLVLKYGSIERILSQVEKIPQQGVKQKLSEHRQEALLSKKLVTIDTAVPIAVDVHELTAQPPDRPRLAKLFSELEFRTLAKKILDQSPPPSSGVAPLGATPATAPSSGVAPLAAAALSDINTDEHSYHLVSTEKEFQSLVKRLGESKRFVFDTETTGTDPLTAELVGLSFAVAPRKAWYVPVAPPGGPSSPGLPPATVLKHLAPVFADGAIEKIGQNIKYDILVLASAGVRVEGALFDTMVANYLLRQESRHNLDALAAEHLGYAMISYDELTGTGKERRPLRQIEPAKVADYSAQDADITFRLYEKLGAALGEQGLLPLAQNVEFPLIPVLAKMELAGVALDTEFLGGLSKEMERMLEHLTARIHTLSGEKFNINSTQQLSRILFEKLGLETGKKTKTGFSTDVGVLEMLRHKHEVIELLLEYRQVQKLKSTYVDALPALINPGTGRVHTSFNQTVAATGRLSSSNPNLQNIPIRTEIGRSIREAFIPGDKGMAILSADYSQIELRVMAHISGDEGLAGAFRNGEDVHTTTASLVFGIPPKEVTREQRRRAKEVNFGIMYGIGPFGLATRLDISQAEAKGIIGRYFERFPGVHGYISDTIEKAKKDGYVSTLLGRRRYLPDITSRNFTVRSNAERQAINMPIQGTAADMIKIAMVRIGRELRKHPMKLTMLLQVHDELVFEAEKPPARGGSGSLAKAKDLIVREMKNALPLSVPVEVEVGVGKNWLEAH